MLRFNQVFGCISNNFQNLLLCTIYWCFAFKRFISNAYFKYLWPHNDVHPYTVSLLLIQGNSEAKYSLPQTNRTATATEMNSSRNLNSLQTQTILVPDIIYTWYYIFSPWGLRGCRLLLVECKCNVRCEEMNAGFIIHHQPTDRNHRWHLYGPEEWRREKMTKEWRSQWRVNSLVICRDLKPFGRSERFVLF